MTNKLRRPAALLLALLLCLPVLSFASPQQKHYADDASLRTQQVVLYFVSADGNRLVPRTQQIELLPSENLLKTLIDLLKQSPGGQINSPFALGESGPSLAGITALEEDDDTPSTETPPVGTQMVPIDVVNVTNSGNLATVELSIHVALDNAYERFLFNLYHAIARTLIESGQVEYVDFITNGLGSPPIRFMTPLGVIGKETEDLSTLWISHQNDGNAQRIYRNVALYFPTKDKQYLVPEVRQIEFSMVGNDYNFVQAIVEAVKRGPQSAELLPSLPADLRLHEDAPLSYFSSTFWLSSHPYDNVNIHFPRSFYTYLQENQDMAQLILGSLTCSVTNFIIQGVNVIVENRQLKLLDSWQGGVELLPSAQDFRDPVRATDENGNIPSLRTRRDFTQLLGRKATVYIPLETGQLQPQACFTGIEEPDLRSRLSLALDAAGQAQTLPAGLSNEHILGLFAFGDTALLNVSSAGVAALEGLSLSQEQALIYSLVNTLTQASGIQRVQFLCDSMVVESFAGWIDLREPLLRNPSLINDTNTTQE